MPMENIIAFLVLKNMNLDSWTFICTNMNLQITALLSILRKPPTCRKSLRNFIT